MDEAGMQTQPEKMKPKLLKLKEVVLMYLDRSGGLQKFVDDCKLYSGNSNQIFKKYFWKIKTINLNQYTGNCNVDDCLLFQTQSKVMLSFDSLSQ